MLLHGVSSELSFKTKCSLCCSFLVTCKLSRIYLNSAQVSVLSLFSLGSKLCDGSVDIEGSLNVPESPGKVGSGWGAVGAGVVPPPSMRFNLGCVASHTGEIALGEMVHSSFKNFSVRGAIYMAPLWGLSLCSLEDGTGSFSWESVLSGVFESCLC